MMTHNGKVLPPTVYVAGPFRGPSSWDIERNIRRAEELAWEVWRVGGAAICPHTNTRFYQGSLPDETWLDGDLAILAGCDYLLTTPDWEKSKGATAEVAFAKDLHIPVLHSLEALVKEIEMRRMWEEGD